MINIYSNKKFFFIILIYLFIQIHNYTGSPMAFSSVAQAISIIEGKLNVDKYINNSNDFSYYNNHVYTGMRPSECIYYIPSVLMINFLSKIDIINNFILKIDNIFNARFIILEKQPRDSGKFILICFLTNIIFILFLSFVIYFTTPNLLRMITFIVIVSTSVLNLFTAFYSQTFDAIGFYFLSIAIFNQDKKSDFILFLSSVSFLIGHYTFVPLGILIFLFYLFKIIKNNNIKQLYEFKSILVLFFIILIFIFDFWFNKTVLAVFFLHLIIID